MVDGESGNALRLEFSRRGRLRCELDCVEIYLAGVRGEWKARRRGSGDGWWRRHINTTMVDTNTTVQE